MGAVLAKSLGKVRYDVKGGVVRYIVTLQDRRPCLFKHWVLDFKHKSASTTIKDIRHQTYS